jgi:Tol biopolymer transport system component
MRKKIFIALIILFVLSSGSLIFYNFLSGKKDGNGAAKSNKASELAIVSDKPAFAPFIESSQAVKYYLAENGHVMQAQLDGSQKKEVSSANLPDLKNITWSPDGKKTINLFSGSSGTKKTVFDYTTQKTTELNGNIRSVAWSPDGKKIAYQYFDGQSNNNISIANADGSSWRNTLQTRLENLVVEWPSPGEISLRGVPASQSKGFLFTVDEATGNLVKIFENIAGFSAKWSPDGQKILYQTTDDKGKNLKLFVADSQGKNSRQLPVATLAEKCAWSADSQKIFCAVPQKLSENATWPEDWLARRVTVKDDFYRLGADGQEKTKIASSDETHWFDVQEILASPQSDYILFTNRRDGLLWSIALPRN